VSYLPPENLEDRPTSVGKGMPNEEVYLVDETGRRLPPGTTGELVVRGGHVMRGYWKKPDETARRLRPGAIPGEMVLHTGDLFRMDADGYLYFEARRDDMINCGGEKVSPREVEDVLLALDGVAEAAVIGVDDPALGQVVQAFVVLKRGCSHASADLMKECAVRLDRAMVPRRLDIVGSLPRTLTEKIDRNGLRRSSAGSEEA
jgi:long-chain acyl-CoA synthetase